MASGRLRGWLRRAVRGYKRFHSAASRHGLWVVPRGFRYAARRLIRTLTGRPLETAEVSGPPAEPRLPLAADDLARLQRRAEDLTAAPMIELIVIGPEKTPESWARTLGSLTQAVYPDLLVSVPNGIAVGPGPFGMPRFVRHAGPRDGSDAAVAARRRLERSPAEFVGFVHPGDEIPPDALLSLIEALRESPDADLLYGDEDRLDVNDRCHARQHKPGWSPELLLCQNYVGRLALVRVEVARRVGDIRPEVGGAWEYDLLLRVGEAARSVVRVPKIVYHRSDLHGSGDPMIHLAEESADAARVAQGALARQGSHGRTAPTGTPGVHLLRLRPQRGGRVTVVIPTRDRAALLRTCVESVLRRTSYPDFEVLVVDNGSTEPETAELFASWSGEPRVRVVPAAGPFNFSRLVNQGVRASDAPYVLLLNNDMEVITPEWLDVLVALLERPGVGAAGAKLYYPDDTIQHAGIILRGPLPAFHGHKQFPRASAGHFGRLVSTCNCSAVTAACLAVSRAAFEEVGGFDERLAVAYNDVDFCLKLRRAGYRIAWTPEAELYHFESASRGSDKSPEAKARWERECALMRELWGAPHDPYYNPNLTYRATDYSPRRADEVYGDDSAAPQAGSLRRAA